MSKKGERMFIKSSILVLLFSLNLFAQVVQTFPIGFHALEKAQSIAPDYAEAITQASQMVGRVLSNVDNGTAYLFYNDEESRWEAHSAYHVVQEEMEAKLPLVMELVDKTWITLDPNNIISSDDEHSTQDRVRYIIDYSGEKPNKIIFTPSNAIESGMAMVEVGYPNVMHKVKVSFGHALMLENNTYWLSTLTSQPGSSGSPVMLLKDEGRLELVGTTTIANNISPFMVIAYRVEDIQLPTVLSTKDFNAWILQVSDPNRNLEDTSLESRIFFSNLLLPYIGKMNAYPETYGGWYQIDHQKTIHDLKDFLERAKQRVESDPHTAANDIKNGIVEYYSRTNNNTTKICMVDFPLLTSDQWNNIAPKDLKPVLLQQLDVSIENLDAYAQRLYDIAQLFNHEQLNDVILNVRELNITENEENFEHYNLPMMSSISIYP